MLTLVIGNDNEAMLLHVAKLVAELRDAEPDVQVVLWPEIKAGWPIPACNMGDVADELIERASIAHVAVVTHSEMLTLRMRRRVAEGELNTEKLEVLWVTTYVADKFEVLADGSMKSWPHTAFSDVIEETGALIRARLNSHKANK